MANIDSAIIEKTARLASLKLDENEKNEYARQLSEIISYVEKIGELDTESVKPTDHIAGLVNVLRDDTVKESMSRDEIAKMAPQFENGHFVVPKIIE